MKINWTVRIKNPVWCGQVALAIIVPILSYFGYSFESMTSWGIVGETLIRAIQNPYLIAITVISILNTLNDPTTHGLCDSIDALKYTKPK